MRMGNSIENLFNFCTIKWVTVFHIFLIFLAKKSQKSVLSLMDVQHVDQKMLNCVITMYNQYVHALKI
jgi:hypothetical protein